MYRRPRYTVTPDRELLGVLDSWMCAMAIQGARGIEAYERIAEIEAHMADTELLYLFDREGDLVAIMSRARPNRLRRAIS
jgi:hypothetical protein